MRFTVARLARLVYVDYLGTRSYEPLIHALLDAFPDDRLHVDRYKLKFYDLLSEFASNSHRFDRPPKKNSANTSNATVSSASTDAKASSSPRPAKLHACDSSDRCASCPRFGPPADDPNAKVLVINSSEMRLTHWDLYEDEVRRRIGEAREGKGEWPRSLVSFLACLARRSRSLTAIHLAPQVTPLARHSSLPELQALVNVFNPIFVYPNTVVRKFLPLELLCMSACFPLGEKEDRQMVKFASWWCEVVIRQSWDQIRAACIQQCYVQAELDLKDEETMLHPTGHAADNLAPEGLMAGVDPKMTRADKEEYFETLASALERRTASQKTAGYGGAKGELKAGRMWMAAVELLSRAGGQISGCEEDGLADSLEIDDEDTRRAFALGLEMQVEPVCEEGSAETVEKEEVLSSKVRFFLPIPPLKLDRILTCSPNPVAALSVLVNANVPK